MTPEEVLKLSKEEIYERKWSKELDNKGENSYCSGCSRCSDCSVCSGCSRCSDCSVCSGCSRCSYCSGCSGCSDCSDCSGCSDCSDCYMCRNAKGLKWAIANVEVGEEDYRAKMKELGVEI
ncbi:MAG: solute carrier organic anion transporter [Sphaerochaeta sp.]|nr:solute carrier organic anion transporter [Sphaerochaeta sp.]